MGPQVRISGTPDHPGSRAAARLRTGDRPAVIVAQRLVAQGVAVHGKMQPMRMMSGAGHDAMIVAPRVPSCMLFLRSPGGLSHHPDESVLAEDVEAALRAGSEFLRLMSER